uniref:ARAD1A01232p n=1 Tax=Blastobotrys adeninivorans TaxID=409370 RepID=A0A060T2E7_BLAAD
MSELDWSFANNFWGKDDAGASVLMERMRSSKQTCEEVWNFYKERMAIEEEYSRKLNSLAKKPLGSSETGTLRDALDVVLSTTQNMAKSHADAANNMKAELAGPLENFATSMRQRRKAVETTMEKLSKAKAADMQTAEKYRQKYESDCNRINGHLAQQNMLMGKELDRNNAKLDRLQQSIEQTKREYQGSLRILAETMDHWNQEWKNGCDRFQDLEEERINFLKSNLWAFTNIVSSVCVNDDEGCETIRVSLEKSEAQKDLEDFVRHRGTGGEIMTPPQFIDYSSGSRDEDTGPRYEMAHFSRDESYDERSSPLNHRKSNASIGFKSSASAMSLPNSVSHLSLKDKSTVEDAMDQPDHDQSNPYANTNSLDHDDMDYNSIPVLAHPETDTSTAQSSPMQGSASPMSSVYSNNTSISSASSVENEEGEKRRTWASPFRKRSKKDIRSAWNQSPTRGMSSGPTTPSAADNVGDTSAATITKSNINRFGSASRSGAANSPSNVLSMGENMFDLGVSRPGSKSPFDRPRSSSPTKTMSKDDPLVAALERLKSSSDNSVPASPSRSDRMYSARSSPTKSSSLVPPGPAFTASEMEQTSERYSSQTREMFQRGQPESGGSFRAAPPMQHQHQQPQRPKSQVDLRSNYNRYDDVSGANTYHTVKARPVTMYGGEDDYNYHQQQQPQQVQERSSRGSFDAGYHNSEGRNHYRSKSASPTKASYDPYRAPSPSPSSYRAASPAPGYARASSPTPSAAPGPSPYPSDAYGRPLSPVPGQPPRRSPSPAPQFPNDNPYSRPLSPNPNYQQAPPPTQHSSTRRRDHTRSKSRQISLPTVASDGRKVIGYARAQYDYREKIAGEVGFKKGDILLVLVMQEDGWWDVEVHGQRRFGLAPSNFLITL